MKANSLEKAILRTLTFYDVFSLPLKEKELYNFLYRKTCTYRELKISIKKLIEKKVVVRKDDYYLLNGSQENIDIYKKKSKITQNRWRKVSKITAKMRWIPFIKLIAVTNSLSFNNCHPDSDIDIFIITKKNRLWITRLLTVLFLDFIGQNMSWRTQADRFCLSFWIDENHLDLSDVLDFPDDLYAYYWLGQMKPVTGINTYRSFITHNKWLKKYLPNWKSSSSEGKLNSNIFKSKVKNFLEFILQGILGKIAEAISRKVQLWRLWSLKDSRKKRKWTVVSKFILKLPPHDPKEYQKKYLKKLNLVQKNFRVTGIK